MLGMEKKPSVEDGALLPLLLPVQSRGASLMHPPARSPCSQSTGDLTEKPFMQLQTSTAV
jgi:hypothetical protein